MGLTRQQKAVLHVAKSKLGLDEESYRGALRAYGGVESSRDLDYQGFLAVMGHFERAGFQKQRRVTSDKGRDKGPVTRLSSLPFDRPGMATAGQVRKIKASWLALDHYYEPGAEWKALRGFLKKRFRVEHENFLTFSKAHQVIEAIKKISSRAGA